MRFSILLTAALVGLLAARVSPTEAGGKGDAAKDSKLLQGTWVSVIKGGPDWEMVFKGDTFTIRRGGKDRFTGTFKLDPAKKPKAIDLTLTGSISDKDEKYKGKTSLGIYELDGDKLKWCGNEPGRDERPKEFTEGSTNLSLVLERQKQEKK